MQKKVTCLLLLFAILLVFAGPAYAAGNNKKETITIDKAHFNKILKRLDDLEREVKDLRNQMTKPAAKPAPDSPAPGKDKPTGELSDEDMLKQLQKEMSGEDPKDEAKRVQVPPACQNPDISVVGDFVWQANHNKAVDGDNPFSLREIELAFEHNVDPWSKANVYVGFHDGHVHVEEGYLSLHKLPFGAKARVGNFFVPFGKDNQTHPHARDYVDMPNVVKNFLGPENLAGTGAEVSYVVPVGKVFTEVTAAAVNDQGSRSFSGGTSGKPLYAAHVRAYTDLSDASNLEVGYSHLRGFNNEAATRLSRLHGLDLTYRWRPTTKGKYKSLLLRGEYLWSRRNNPDRVLKSDGGYALARYQLNRNWFLGARYDNTGFPGLVDSREKAYSGILTYYPTEFAYYRLQYKHTDRNYARKLRELWFQINFMMGPHGAHDF